jgi:ankyrin repeat protein
VQLTSDEPRPTDVAAAIRAGDLTTLRRLLDEHPDLASASIEFTDGTVRSMLHIATDWPGHFPNVTQTIAFLIAAGADVNARFRGGHTETPLHWAAGSDDADALDALLDAGADIEAEGAVIAGGTALTDAVAFAQWRAADRLIERGARSTLFEPAAMGLLDRVETCVDRAPAPTAVEISSAFWAACHGGRRDVAEYLLTKGADIEWAASWNGSRPIDAATSSEMPDIVGWLVDQGARPAGSRA